MKTIKEVNEFIQGRNTGRYQLTQFKNFLSAVNNPQRKIKCIHITGTNGKGSTANFISEMLVANGYKIGLYTSPAVSMFFDGIKINGKIIEERFVIEETTKYQQLFIDYQLSEFEIMTFLMFQYFIYQQIDIAIIEVGMGGELDATNVIDSIISIITNIQYDHLDKLGKTLKEIATAKAGIIRPNSYLVLGPISDIEADQVIKSKAKELNTKVIEVSDINDLKADARVIEFCYQNNKYRLNDQPLYQVKNLVTALETIYLLKNLNFKIDPKIIQKSIDNFFHPLRFEQIGDNIYLDGAHNPDGIRELNQTLALQKKKVLVIFSALRDKDYFTMLEILSKHEIIITDFIHPRALKVQELTQTKYKYLPLSEIITNLPRYKDRLIVFTGSLYFASAVKKILRGGKK